MFNSTYPSKSPRAPPVHAPLPDPFTHEDPFLPSAKRPRRNSIDRSEIGATSRLPNDNRSVAWSTNVTDHRRQQSAPLNGPASLQLQCTPTSDSEALMNETARRRSISGISHAKNGVPLEPPVYRPAYLQNEMSPPTPPHLPKSYPATNLSKENASSHTNGHRSGGGKFSARPAGSMPISSLIGTDDAPSRPQSQSITRQHRHSTSNEPTSSREYMRPHSPNSSSPSSRQNTLSGRRPYTPEVTNADFAANAETQPLSGRSLSGANINGYASPNNGAESSRFDKQSYSPTMPKTSFKVQNYQTNSAEASCNEAPLSTRPKSQPTQSPFSYSTGAAWLCKDGREAKESHVWQAQDYDKKRVARTLVSDEGNGLEVEGSQSLSALTLPFSQRQEISSLLRNQRLDGDRRRASAAKDHNADSSSRSYSSEKGGSEQRESRSHNGIDSVPSIINARNPKDDFNSELSGVDRHFPTPPNNSNNYRKRPENAWLAVNSGQENQKSKSVFADGSSRRMEELPHHKVLAGITSENNKKTGRASPLPQAVQGAQAQPAGPGGNPNIKNEFGRMFSGLGSGLSSAPPNNGITTPSRLSPLPRRSHDGVESAPPHGNVNIESSKLTRTGSFPGRKFRQVKGDASFPGDGGADGRSTPGAMLEQSSGRSRYTRSSHHHHHPPIGHHHHHHHHHISEEEVQQAAAQKPSATKYHLGHVLDNLDNSLSNHRRHHHHHHHHTHLPHHHHIQGKHGPMALEEPLHLPNVTVLSQEIHDSIKNLPQHHLGSLLYQPTVSRAPSASTPLDAKFGYRSRFKSLPLFKGKENCTVTVRIPRYYLSREQRELICLDRNLYGTDIYTDDSDPLAAAIHCGWIRGEWPAEVDTSLLQAASSAEQQLSHVGFSDHHMDGHKQSLVMVAPPRHGPVQAKRHLDLHITLRVLPPLQRYASSVRHGLKSRSWGSNHDGMSFEIIRFEWIDEGTSSRGEERTGAARRKRLRTAMSLMGTEELGQMGLVGAAA